MDQYLLMDTQQYHENQRITLVATSSNHAEIILIYKLVKSIFGWNHDPSYSRNM